MSTTIDNKVVEMRFDNKQFESATAQSMSTLEKLKSKLNFEKSAKSLDGLNESAKKVNMSGLSGAVETVHSRFSALQVIGVTALANITNSAVNAGKTLVKSLTIDPIKTGFNEYELKMGSIQTIMASTGASLETVNKYLEELNKYSDQTIYSFQDMTSNIGKFTNAGVKLEDAVLAIKGISNEAAVSGATSAEASRAMYNFSQALSAGYVKLIDWKSIENANMATVEFKNQLIESAVAAGTLTKAGDGMYKTLSGNVMNATQNFNDTLQDQWMTSEVLIGTLSKYADETTDIGKKATQAATEVKTFSQMLDTLKESAQSGWAQTWEIVFGDFNEGKALWTKISEVVGGALESITESRNEMLKKALDGTGSTNAWDKLTKKINKAGIETKDFQEALTETAKKHDIDVNKMIDKEGSFVKTLKNGWLTKGLLVETLEDYSKNMKKSSKSQEDMNAKLKLFQGIVDDVWKGDYKNGEARMKALTKAGYKYSEVQELVNKTVDGHKLTLDDLSDVQLKAVGYTEKEIAAVRKLASEAKKSGSSIDGLIDSMRKMSGRELLTSTFRNFGTEFKKIIDAVKEAYNEVFNDGEDGGDMLYNFIERLHDLSEAFTITKDQAEAFKNIAKGLFSIFELGTSVISLSVVGGLKILCAVLNLFGTDLLKVCEYLANLITGFRDWIDENTLLIGKWDKIGTIIGTVVQGFKDLFAIIKEMDIFKKFVKTMNDIIDKLFGMDAGIDGLLGGVEGIVKKINKLFENIGNWLKALDKDKEFNKAAENCLAGFAKGLENGISSVIETISGIATTIIEKFKEVLGIHSPSVVFMALGGFVIAGLLMGLKGGAPAIFDFFASIGDTILTIVSDIVQKAFPAIWDMMKNLGGQLAASTESFDIDFGSIFTAGVLAGILFLAKKAIDIADKIVSPLESIKDAFGGLKDLFGDIGSWFKARVWKMRAEALFLVAKSVLMLAAACALLTLVDQKKLWSAIGAIAAISVIIGALTVVAANAAKDGNFKDFGKLAVMIIAISTSLLIMSIAMKTLAGIDAESAKIAMYLMSGLLIGMTGMIAAFGAFVKDDVSKNIGKVGTMFLRMAAAMAIVALAMKIIATMSWSEIGRGAAVITGLLVIFAGFVALSKFAGKFSNRAGKMFVRMVTAIAGLVLVIKLISGISDNDISRGMKLIIQMEILFAAIMLLSDLAGVNAAKAGVMFLLMATAISILVTTIKSIAKISKEDLAKGFNVVMQLEILFMSVMLLSEFVGDNAGKAGLMFLAMAASIAIMGFAIKTLAGISKETLKRGFAVVAGIEVLFAAMMLMSNAAGPNADKAGKMMLKMSIAVLILVGAIALLSFIKTEDLIAGTTAITILLGMFGGILFLGNAMQGSMKTLTVLTVAIGLLVGSLVVLSLLDTQKVLKASLAISAVLGMFAIVIAAANFAKGAMKVLITLTAAIAVIGGVLYLLSSLPNPENTIDIAKSMSLLLIALSAAFVVLSYTGTAAVKAIPALLAMTLAVGMLAGIFILLDKLDVATPMETAASLSLLLIAMSTACLILAAVGATGPAALIGAAVLDGVIIAIGGLLVGLGALMKYVPEVEEFLDKGISILEKIGYGLGSFLGNFVGGIAGGVTDVLPKMGADLGAFMTNAKPFLDGIKSIDEGAANGAKALAGAILSLTAADIIDSMTSWFTGGVSFADFGKQIAVFGPYMKQYSDAVQGVDAEAIKSSAVAAKNLTEVAKNIPNSGGLWGKLAGENDMVDFAKKLVPFGESLKKYGVAVQGVDSEAINASVSAAEGINKVAAAIPNSGGLVALFTGDNDILSFSTKLTTFGQSLVSYGSTVSGLDTESIANSVIAAQSINELSKSIPKSGGLWGLLAGDDGLDAFGSNLKKFGAGLKKYSEKIAGIDSAAITASVGIIEDLTKMFNSMNKINTNGAEQFKESVDILAKANINRIANKFTDSAKSFSSIGNTMVISLASGISSKSAVASTAANKVISNLIKTISGRKDSMTTAGSNLMNALIKGAESKKTLVKSAFTSAVKDALSAVKVYKENFTMAGKNLAQGLINGLKNKDKLKEAYNAGYKLGAKAAKGVKDGSKENSPSKLTYQYGVWQAVGLINGIVSMTKQAYNAGYDLGDTAARSMSESVGKIASVLDSDMETQPTIRPVLDLSDVRSGVGAIDGMFGTPSIGVMSNLGAINSMMNSNIQNGGNLDVIAAIDKLGKSLGNIGGDTYNVNGITYDDGTNVSNAVQEIVRAARMGRRA